MIANTSYKLRLSCDCPHDTPRFFWQRAGNKAHAANLLVSKRGLCPQCNNRHAVVIDRIDLTAILGLVQTA